jgi:nucleoside-diphosphate-sugar epimerase
MLILKLTSRHVSAFFHNNIVMPITLVVNPPFFYGPLAPALQVQLAASAPNYQALSTSLFIYRFISPSGIYPVTATYADVRDVAKAHVLALKSPLSTEPGIGRKRLIMASLDEFDYRRVRELIAAKRPSLKERIISSEPPEVPLKRLPYDYKRLEQVLGLQADDFHSVEETVLDTIDSLVKLESEWLNNGYKVEVPMDGV